MTNLLIRDPVLAAPFRLMDELIRSTGNGNRVTGFTPLVDVHETEDEYLVRVDLPGVKADDVNVEVNENVLSISGSRVAEETGGWEVRIMGRSGSVAWSRPCADAAEARTFASTVQQHIYWLSPEKFRATTR